MNRIQRAGQGLLSRLAHRRRGQRLDPKARLPMGEVEPKMSDTHERVRVAGLHRSLKAHEFMTRWKLSMRQARGLTRKKCNYVIETDYATKAERIKHMHAYRRRRYLAKEGITWQKGEAT